MEMVEVLREGNEQAVRSTACAWWFGDIACDHVKKEKKGGAMMTIVEMIKSLAFQLLRSASPEATIEGLDAARIQGLHSKEEWVDLLCAVVRSVGRMRFLLMGMGMGMGMGRLQSHQLWRRLWLLWSKVSPHFPRPFPSS